MLLPAFAAYGDPEEPCVVRMLVDHVRIREQAQRLEREVFGLIEAALPPEAAEALVEAVLRGALRLQPPNRNGG